MVNASDVEPSRLLEKTAQKLKDMKIEKPAYVGFTKTGPFSQRPPTQENFWYLRCASILRQAYLRGTIGVSRLRTHYGGKEKRGVRPAHHRRAGGNTIRKAMQTLEKAGLLAKLKVGRVLTPKGRKFLDAIAKEVS